MKVIIAGPRRFFDYDKVVEAIEASTFKITEVVSGAAKGVDSLGERWAKENGVPISQFKPLWNDIEVPGAIVAENKFGKYNKRAGIDRNVKMAEYAEALIAIDGDTAGTGHMISTAQEKGLNVYVHKDETKIQKTDGYIWEF